MYQRYSNYGVQVKGKKTEPGGLGWGQVYFEIATFRNIDNFKTSAMLQIRVAEWAGLVTKNQNKLYYRLFRKCSPPVLKSPVQKSAGYMYLQDGGSRLRFHSQLPTAGGSNFAALCLCSYNFGSDQVNIFRCKFSSI